MNKFIRTFKFINSHPLAKRHPVRAYARFISWQIRSIVFQTLIPINFIGATQVYAKRGLTGITGSIYTGLHEFEEMAFLLHLLRPEDTFFDVGANIGSYTILASGVACAHSICFEPVPATFRILKKNLELNKLQERVLAVNCAVANSDQNLHFTCEQDTTNHVILNSTNEPGIISVPVVKLDKYSREAPLLIKIDVEGFESEVIAGAFSLLRQKSLKAIIIELNGSGSRYMFDDAVVHAGLIELGFQPYRYDPFARNLTKLDSPGDFNTIYLRDLPFIKDRLKSSKGFKVFSRTI
jgi:FkbM family methyltransferase